MYIYACMCAFCIRVWEREAEKRELFGPLLVLSSMNVEANLLFFRVCIFYDVVRGFRKAQFCSFVFHAARMNACVCGWQ